MNKSTEENISEAVLKQFENNVNKWTLDLMDQEKDFINKATQINEWDKIIKKNGNSLNAMCQTIKNVMICQKQIICDLDFIKSQQAELEKVVVSMESDPNRLQTNRNEDQRRQLYELAESIDTNMKRLSEDLKEVIETINENVMGGYNPNDPILQIGRILNANVNSLKWIDDYSNKIKHTFEKVAKEQEEKVKEEELKTSKSQ
ncbi:nuclear pore glycoprotein p62-like [Cimex lectularius]|uniref:Nucleoporin NSP1-like C-terminal domain-containing protein n=1 Tax=Cimex lectularius TaxID=79782 RepID=A0A8I6S5C3_CIMLE|nr:nuclear pore glycoprotein p62-like [Cimex lectularius]